MSANVLAKGELTVEVISAEHTSQIYFSPPSVPRDMVFFLMTPIVRACQTPLLLLYRTSSLGLPTEPA